MKNARLDRRIMKEIEQFLKEKRAELMVSVRSVISERAAPETVRCADPDPADRASETLHDEIRVALMDRRSDQVVQIEAALDRLARGEYGSCQDCGDFIGLARLRALPFAQRCRACQARVELEERRESRPVPAFVRTRDDEDW